MRKNGNGTKMRILPTGRKESLEKRGLHQGTWLTLNRQNVVQALKDLFVAMAILFSKGLQKENGHIFMRAPGKGLESQSCVE